MPRVLDTAALTLRRCSFRSAERKPQDSVFLVVRKQSGQWQFPQAVHSPGETVRQARRALLRGCRRTGSSLHAARADVRARSQVAERALAQTATGLAVHFLGNAPAAHLATPKETTFFMRASYLSGSPRPTTSGAFTGAPPSHPRAAWRGRRTS